MNINKKNLSCILLSMLALLIGAYSSIFLVSERQLPDDSIIAVSAPDVKHEEDTNRKICVILDPGHGGMDSGAVGVDGCLEKERNLSLALLLEKNLAGRGIETVLTRTEDTMLSVPGSSLNAKTQDLKARTMLASRYENCIFVSIHMNQYPIEKYSGLQIWYGGKNAASASLADAVRTSVTKTLQPENHRENKKAGSNIYVLRNADVPAILVECGFLSNRSECQKLGDPLYQASLADAIAEGIESYIKNTAK